MYDLFIELVISILKQYSFKQAYTITHLLHLDTRRCSGMLTEMHICVRGYVCQINMGQPGLVFRD